MSTAHYFSLRTTFDKVTASVAIAVGGAGFFVAAPRYESFLIAVVAGLLLGAADSFHFLNKKWSQMLAILAWVLLAAEVRDRFNPALGIFGQFFVTFQFLAVGFVIAIVVVGLADEVRRRLNDG